MSGPVDDGRTGAPHRSGAGTEPVLELRLHRDRLTVALYAAYAMWGWFLFSYGPAVNLLREEEGTSRSIAGLHGTSMALGTLAAALASVVLAQLFGRRRLIQAGAVAISLGGIGMATGTWLPVTLLAGAVAGFGSGLVINSANGALGEHHHESGAAAISEANAVCTGLGLVAPLVLGALAGTVLGWRTGMALVVLLAVAAVVLVRRLPDEPALHAPPLALHRDRRPMSRRFWLLWGALVCAVAVEFGTTFWALDLLRSRLDVSVAVGAAAVTAFVLGMTLGRFALVRLTLRVRLVPLLATGFAVALAGWALLWTASSAAVALTGLVVGGIGLAPAYPVLISLLMAASDRRNDRANAMAGVGGAMASGSAPFVLGALADALGTHRAFVVIAVLLVAAGCLLVAAVRAGDYAVVRSTRLRPGSSPRG